LYWSQANTKVAANTITYLLISLQEIADYVLGCPDSFNGATPEFSAGQCPWDINTPCYYNNGSNYQIPLYVCQPLVYMPIAVCEDNCTSPESRNASQIMVKGITALVGFQNLLDQDIIPLLQCTIVKKAWNGLNDVFCVELV
jgi:hypothetical protein